MRMSIFFFFFFLTLRTTQEQVRSNRFQSLSSMILGKLSNHITFFFLTFSFTICKMEMIISIFMRLLWGLNAKMCIKWLKQNIVHKKYSPKVETSFLIYSYCHFCLYRIMIILIEFLENASEILIDIKTLLDYFPSCCSFHLLKLKHIPFVFSWIWYSFACLGLHCVHSKACYFLFG